MQYDPLTQAEKKLSFLLGLITGTILTALLITATATLIDSFHAKETPRPTVRNTHPQ